MTTLLHQLLPGVQQLSSMLVDVECFDQAQVALLGRRIVCRCVSQDAPTDVKRSSLVFDSPDFFGDFALGISSFVEGDPMVTIS